MVAHNQRYEAGEVSWWRKVTEHYDLTMEEIEKALGLGTAATIFRSSLVLISTSIDTIFGEGAYYLVRQS